MQVRYCFNPDLSQVHSRLASRLLSGLKDTIELKAEYSSIIPVAGLKQDWSEIYSILSRPLFQPRYQIVHGWPDAYVYHPLQWNILLDPPRDLQSIQADEIWVFSQEAEGYWRQKSTLPITCLPMSCDLSGLKTDAELPLELEEPHVLLASLRGDDPAFLTTLLTLYFSAFKGCSDTILVLHLDKADASEADEEKLMALVLQIANNLGLAPENLNLGTWIGSLEPSAYLALLNRADLLLVPDNEHHALEALTLGKKVLGPKFERLSLSAELTVDNLKHYQELSMPNIVGSDFAAQATCSAIVERLNQLEREIDFVAREHNWLAKQAQQGQEGRKQQYSLFHSDYNQQEMQMRRQWHERYARYFEQSTGNVLDIGCGSGIFLEILREWCLPAFGLDPDPDMVTVCHDLGLQAIQGDERRLSEFQTGSVGGIHASHVIEHVDGDRAIALVENAWRILKPGGRLVIRTPNWRNESVRKEGFWLDITHIRPYPLPLLEQVLKDAGFELFESGFEEFGWNDTFIVGVKKGGVYE